MTNGMAIPQKIKHRIPIWYSNSTSGYMPKRCETGTGKDMWTPMSTASVLTRAKVKVTQVYADRWMNKQNLYVHIMDNYSP